MKKLLVLTFIAIGFSLVVKAQKFGMTRYSLGAEVGGATGTFSNFAGLGLGASIQTEHFFQENVSGTALFGVIDYFGASVSNNTKYKSTLILPLRVGGRYYIGDGFHLGAQIGVGFISGGVGSTTAFAYSPQIGYNFKTNKGRSIDATFKYDGYASTGSLSALGIRVAYIL